VAVTFFATCSLPGRPSIEELGNALGTAIRNLNVPQVDLVTFSMGGLVVRSYLAGKQPAPGAFTPPVPSRVRKWISIATPNFGALVPSIVPDFLLDTQVRQLVPASQFLFDLATWNQNHDDLRGVDAVAIIGSAGGTGILEGASDGTVGVTSASLSFAEPDERTRVLPYCHGTGFFTAILGFGCDAPPLAKIQTDNPLSWQIIDSFLSGTDAWRSVGQSPRQNKVLSQYGGVISQARDSTDTPQSPIRDRAFATDAPMPGGYTVVIDKPGPLVALIAPSAARLLSLSLAPRMLVSLYGNNLTGATVSVNGQTLALNYTGEHQVNALLPAGVTGLVKLTVSNPQGRQTLNIFVEDAAPAIFTANGSGTGPAAIIRTGNAVSLFLTGLGNTTATPTVTVNGVPATVTYSGPAPGFPGLDQINIVPPVAAPSGTVVVTVGNRSSNTVVLPDR
jgi:uncharacterized protein (TIGR03437 family)